jgi:cob(I)alamin adenosyltransferase
MKTKGLIMVHTGYGKGKTTAALGMAFRALGHGLPVCIIQFVKGTWKYGEMDSAKRFEDLLEFHVVGKGFTWKSKDPELDRLAARDGWELAKAKIEDGRHNLVILDEFTYALNYKMVDKDEVVAFLRQKPERTHVLVTGRDAPAALVEIADLVTEMREMKHPFRSGVAAQKGIEF